MVSDPVHQAVENLHPADGMLHRDAGFRRPAVVFLLGGCEFGVGVFLGFPRPFVRQVYSGFSAVIRFRPLEAEIEPQIHFVEPFRPGVEDLFHKGVVVHASGDEAEQEKDLSAQGREGERLERVAFFFRCRGLPGVPCPAA